MNDPSEIHARKDDGGGQLETPPPVFCDSGAPVEPVPAQTDGGAKRFGSDYESAPVPAPRLEWRDDGRGEMVGTPAEGPWYIAVRKAHYGGWYLVVEGQCTLPTLDAAKSLAEKLNELLSPPVGESE